MSTPDPGTADDEQAVDPAGPIGPVTGAFIGPALDLYAGQLTGAPTGWASTASTAAEALGGPTRAALATDLVTCPECGQLATVDMARRQAEDFCRNCDFPLFWARGTVIAPAGEETGASLRRLPGTVGRAATASLLCPHCGEPNSPAADLCIRCALSLHPVEIPEPEPLPVVEPEPEPDPEPEPEPSPRWWVFALVVALLVVVFVVLVMLRLP